MSLFVDHKYAGLVSSSLRNFKRTGTNLYNFSCPICGDSKKNRRSARGYLYEFKGSLRFKCHNECGGLSMRAFLTSVDSGLANQYASETFVENGGRRRPEGVEESFVIPLPDKPTVDPLEALGLKRVSELDPEKDIARAYVEYRRIPSRVHSDLWYVDDATRLTDLNPEYRDPSGRSRLPNDKRLVIPFRGQNGSLIGLGMRALCRDPKLRYCTLRILQHPLVYGLERVDMRRKIWVLEGQIDAMHVQNAVAAGGSDMNRFVHDPFYSKTIRCFVLDNEPRARAIVEKMEKLYSRGESVFVPPAKWTHNDINAAVMAGVTEAEVMDVLNTNTWSGPGLRLALDSWKRT